MTLTETPLGTLGSAAPNFSLLGVDNKIYTLSDVKGGKGTLVMFICNHCPYVLAIIDRLVEDIKQLQEKEIGVVAVMPNAVELVPKDSYEDMKLFSEEKGFTFPYTIDETQETARSYDAVCTPDFFGFNSELKLQYRGRLDNSGRSLPTPDTKRELFEAMLNIARTGEGPIHQYSSMGCSIKWR